MIGISAFQTLYQTYYPDEQLPYLVPKTAVLLNMFLNGNTDGQVSGDQVDMPWLLGPSTGVSQSYATAAAATANAPLALRPIVRMSQLYANMGFLDKDDLLSKGEASYGDLMETVVRGKREDFLNKADQLFHGNGSGNRAGFLWASATPTVLALVSSPSTMNNATTSTIGAPVGQSVFEVNDSVVITSTNLPDGSSPTIIAGGPYTITAVNGNSNTVTISPTPAGLTDGYVFGLAIAGDTLGFNTTLLTPSVIGVQAFNPYGGPSTTDSFLGVNRSVYGTRAAGTWFDASTNYSIEQGARKGLTQMANTGLTPGGVTSCWHPDDYDTLDFKLTAQNRYSTHQLGAAFFDSLAISSTMGRVDAVVDCHQEKGFVRHYAPQALQLMYKNGLPHFATLSNGTDQQFGSNYDGREMRMRAYFQLRSRDPRKLGVTKLGNSI